MKEEWTYEGGNGAPANPLSPLRGERVRVRGASYARFAPHPRPLPAERGEGT
jgi:hypothetical protein